MQNRLFKYTLSLVFAFTAISSFAQVKTDDKKPLPDKKTTITEEIEVVRPYKPVLADAVKIRRSPNLENTKPFKPNLSYSITDKKLELNTDIRQLQAQQLADEKENVLQNNFAKIGIGNFSTGLGELYINTGKDPALQAGFFAKHLNQKGDFNSQKLSRQQFGIFGRSIQEKVSLNGELKYDRLGTNFYGYNPAASTYNLNPASQRYDVIGIKGEAIKNYSDADGDFDYAGKVDAYTLKDLNEKKENSFAVSGFFNKAWNQFNFGINASADFTSIKDSAINSSNNIFKANPYVKLQGDNYKIIVGLNFISEFGDAGRTNLLPAVTAEVPIVPGYATIFAGYTGDVLKTSLLNLSRENPYLNKKISVINAVEKSKIYGGVKGNAGSGFGYSISAHYTTIMDMPFFVNNYPKIQKFDVIYDPGDSRVFGIEGEISLTASQTFSWTGKVIANSYKLATVKEAWFKPGLEVISNARISINKKFSVDGDVHVYGDSKGREFVTSPAFAERAVALKSFVDLSAGAQYQLKNKIGLYVHANNLFGTAYQQYLFYPKIGLNVLGGLSYSF